MNLQDISTQLLFTTVPITGKTVDNKSVFGTGFLFSYVVPTDSNISVPLLVTNYHVLENLSHGQIEFCVQRNGEPILSDSVKVTFDNNIVQSSKLPELDIAVIPIAQTMADLSNKGVDIFFKTINPELIPDEQAIQGFSAIETLTFIGYPSGLYDGHNHLSIVRQGITATPLWNNYLGRSEFLIDGGVYPGSSGSPVFIYNQGAYAKENGITIGNRLIFVGIIYGTQVNNDSAFLNLGVAINSWSFYNALKSHLKPFLDKENLPQP
ncbi:MAG: serine protease [Eubacteriales bacterium]|nr:serine protease [Eubacteriales bacterium]